MFSISVGLHISSLVSGHTQGWRFFFLIPLLALKHITRNIIHIYEDVFLSLLTESRTVFLFLLTRNQFSSL